MNQIRSLRTQRKMTQVELAKLLNVAQNTVSYWEKGKTEPDFETITRLSEIFGVSADYLLGRTAEKPITPPRGVKIPVLGDVQAGLPIEAIENIIDYEDIPESMARTGEYFGLRIRGTSMEPKFSEGDVVIVRKQPTVESGEIAVVLVNGDSATIKKIKRSAAGITLIPTNQAFEPIFYDNEEIESLPVTIIGKVVELRAKF